jgi:deoxycytidine triphosphate deaminase
MLLNHAEIDKRGIIGGAVPTGFRAASYDVRIGKIIAIEDGKIVDKQTYILKPQGVVEVISAERVTLKDDVAGFAMVKTSLCNEGVLALNIGIIDPYYNGHVSTTLLNFSKQDRVLSVDDPFLRLTFHECRPAEVSKKPKEILTDPQYERDRREKMGRFSPTFLNLEASISTAIRKPFLYYGALFGLFFAALTFFINFGLAFASYWMWRREDFLNETVRRLSTDRHQQIEAYERQIDTIADAKQREQNLRLQNQQHEIDDLRKKLDTLEARAGKKP